MSRENTIVFPRNGMRSPASGLVLSWFLDARVNDVRNCLAVVSILVSAENIIIRSRARIESNCTLLCPISCFIMGFCTITCQLLLAAASISSTSAKWIVPGARWRDTDGKLVNAHAGGITVDQESGKFFWFGEYKVQGQEEGGGVSVYSSDDLATWEHHGMALCKFVLLA
jgi:hypothetical protein